MLLFKVNHNSSLDFLHLTGGILLFCTLMSPLTCYFTINIFSQYVWFVHSCYISGKDRDFEGIHSRPFSVFQQYWWLLSQPSLPGLLPCSWQLPPSLQILHGPNPGHTDHRDPNNLNNSCKHRDNNSQNHNFSFFISGPSNENFK